MIPMDGGEIVIVGAGVVGLAIARRLAQAGHECLVLEAAAAIGTGISSRSSEVIHAGIYYPPHSLKARLCVAGRDLLYAYAAAHGVAHARPGKLILAHDAEEAAGLAAIARQAALNGVGDLVALSCDAVQALEPDLVCAAALFSPSTGIIDSHGLMMAYAADVEAAGGLIVCRSPVLSGVPDGDGWIVRVGGDEPCILRCRWLINAAGLGAIDLAHCLRGVRDIPSAYYCKGRYAMLLGKVPFRHLIYPMPGSAGLGVHLTLDLAGQARFGPDVVWVDQPDYRVEPEDLGPFYDAIRRYWPGLAEGGLAPGYAGIRPKIVGPSSPPADFRIDGPEAHGVSGLVTLWGIESPGLTASLAIADRVGGLVEGG